jgi:hypothetical protein
VEAVSRAASYLIRMTRSLPLNVPVNEIGQDGRNDFNALNYLQSDRLRRQLVKKLE